MLNMFVYLLSSALEKHAPFKNKFLNKKIPKLFKETWFDEECKYLLRERQFVYEKYSKNLLPKNWSACSNLRSNLSSVLKEKQGKFSWNFFYLSNCQQTAGDLIVEDKKIAEHFTVIFSNLGQCFGWEYENAPIFKAGDESFSFCPITEKGFDILKQIVAH